MTEKMHNWGLADDFQIKEWLIEAGPAYVDDAIEKAKLGVEEAGRQIKARSSAPYRKT